MIRAYLPPLRRTVQAGFALFCLFGGLQFYRFTQWAIDRTTTYVARPPMVEGFLPISALVSLKRLILTGEYDPIHPAGLTIFLAALALGLLLRKGFCGWICPLGLASNLAETVGRRTRLLKRVPKWLDLPLLSLKYLLLAFFAYQILWGMDLQAIEGFLRSPYNLTVDLKMLYFFLSPSRLAGGVMLGLLLLSLVVKNPWCRYLCPYGALLGLLALASPLQVKRDPKSCINCQKCARSCPAAIQVPEKETVRTPECFGCLECVAVCPVDACLDLRVTGRRIHPLLLPALVLALFFGCWLTAKATGHWHNQLPVEVLKKSYQMGLNMAHPR